MLFFLALTLILVLGLRSVLFPGSSEGISVGSGAGIGKTEIAKIEELIKQAVELKQAGPVAGGRSGSGANPEAEKAYHAAQAEIKKLKDTLAQKDQEISTIKSSQGSAQGSGSAMAAGAGDTSELSDKIRNLEAKLAEYEIISEDIADLSKYKQENERLKKKVEELSQGKPGAVDDALADPNDPPIVGKSNFAKPDPAPQAVKPAEAQPVSAAPVPSPEPEEQDAKTPAPDLAAQDSSPAVDDDLMKEFAQAVEEQKAAKGSPALEEASEGSVLDGAPNLDALATEAEGLGGADIGEVQSSLEGDLDTDKLAAEATGMVSEDDKQLMEDFQQVVANKS